MKYQTINILILGFLLVQSHGVNCADTSKQFQEKESSFIRALESAILATPYSALIQHTSVDIVSIPDSDPKDDYVEEKHIYHARVLETYRGQQLENISYTMIVEKGEAAIINEEPVIITLCGSNESLYWPGVGSQFPATEKVIKNAKRISHNVKLVEQTFPSCE